MRHARSTLATIFNAFLDVSEFERENRFRCVFLISYFILIPPSIGKVNFGIKICQIAIANCC